MKKITAITTTFIMLLSLLFQTAAFAAFSDVDDSNSYKKAITTLTTLGVIHGKDENTFAPKEEISRKDFTTLIVYLLGYEDLKYSSSDFTDVSIDASADIDQGNYIQTAYNLGIISGMGDGTFAPDSPVTYEQALKMIVCMLGYEDFAQAQTVAGTGWAEKYIKQANSLGLMKNISDAVSYEGAPREVVAQALYNALEVEMYEYNGITWNKTEKTLLGDYLKIKELKGTLVGVEDSVTEYCTVSLLEAQMDIRTSSGEEVIISYADYTTNKSDITKYLGNTITVYYRQSNENEEKTLVIIDEDTSKNSQLEINYDDLNSLSGTTLKYYDSSAKSKTIKLKEKDFTVYYNGQLISTDATVELTNPSTGEQNSFTRQEALERWLTADTDYTIYGNVIITDSGDDGTYDMAQIYDYDTIVAYSAPTTSDYRITDKLVTGNYLILDPQAANYTYTITKDNSEIALTSIAANDVVLYAKSLDESTYSLLVSNKTVSGTVSSMNSAGTELTISNTSYKIGDKCASYIKDKSGRDLKTGVSGTFYLDALGTVVFGVLNQETVIPYGYIANAYLDYDEGGKAYITAFTSSNSSTADSYKLKDRVKLNGSSVNSEAVIDKLAESAAYSNGDADIAESIYGAGKTPNLTGYSQPARITISDNVVTEIVTLTSDEVQTQNEDNEQLVKCKELAQYTYSSSSFTQSGKSAFSVNSSTIVICVPANRSEKKSYIKKIPSSAFTSGESYYVEAFDINSSKIAGLVILYGNDSALTKVKKDTDFSIVASDLELIYNDDRDASVFNLEVFAGTSNVLKTWKTYDDTEFAGVKVGDVIQFAYDSDNYAQGLITNIAFDDIAAVLDGKTNNGQLYNWEEEQEPSEDNNYQSYKFDYRFKSSGSADETYYSSTLGAIPYSRACMYNVSQVLLEDKKLYVTKGGFSASDGSDVIDDGDYEEITITSSTKIVRMENDRDEISRYVADTTTDMSINDLRDAKNYGKDCSKILVCSSKGSARMIVVYN